MFTPLEEAGISPLPNESTVSPPLASSIADQRNLYAFPTAGLTISTAYTVQSPQPKPQRV
ncbi:MAG TPA: hypothetical protein VK993_14070 [Chthoniobacterales bacterium]|nr:hypothetical protein [Chthoniobacterales bacterium]